VNSEIARWLVPKMVKNGSYSIFAYLRPDLGLFDEQILAVSKDGNSRGSNKSERKQSLSIAR
jgi:hypothetical protein